ncbi:MAG: PepSY domain-containing protein, partial [Pseudomonadota bacterium]
IDAAQDFVGDKWIASGVEINNVYASTHVIVFDRDASESHDHRRVVVDPVNATVLGEKPESPFFRIVLDIHRRLYAGTFGRILVELTTCWTIFLTLTGFYLWWPKSWRKLAGVLKPRLKGNKYVALRDIHAIPGALLSPILILIAFTGLLYSVLWGTAYLTIGFTSGAFDLSVNPPQSTVPTGEAAAEQRISPDDVYGLMRDYQMPTVRISIELPTKPESSYAIKSGYTWGPSIASALFVDQYSGEVIQSVGLLDLPVMAQWALLNYPLHVGSIMGLASKVLWLVACLILCAAPITGVWMWLQRRKPNQTGFPKRYHARLPSWLMLSLAALGVCLPIAGLSMIVIAVGDWIAARMTRTNSMDAEG